MLLSEPFEINGADLHISASVGIAFSGAGTDVPEQVLQEADTAMYMSKRAGGDSHTTLDLREYSTATQRTNLNHDLRGALERQEIYCDYQPIIATDGGRVVGAEALVRWAHPVQGIVAPDVLIPLAEHSGLINQIGRWVLVRACEDRHRWLEGPTPSSFQVSVNVSARQLMTAGFSQVVEDVLRETATNPRRITLEVTESVFVHDVQRAQRVLGELRQLGVHLALDDFGTGYSSLGYLKQFPVDILKIDRLFIQDIDSDVESCLIVGAIVNLAHALHIIVVAEGIETAAQYNRVAAFGADACQGFYFARPMSADAIGELMSSPLAANCTPRELDHRYREDPVDEAGADESPTTATR
jgi:EAL domain-containing protein (putative c-di-GMP-specific phosphodiesterase class I)